MNKDEIQKLTYGNEKDGEGQRKGKEKKVDAYSLL